MAPEQQLAKPQAGIGVGAALMASVSSGLGSISLDALAGAGVGYFISPRDEKLPYALGGALAGGLGGVLGVGVLLAWRYWRR